MLIYMEKCQFIANVGDIRKRFVDYREELQKLLVVTLLMEKFITLNKANQFDCVKCTHHICSCCPYSYMFTYGKVQNPE